MITPMIARTAMSRSKHWKIVDIITVKIFTRMDERTKTMNLVIERSKWLRGEGWNESYLLRSADNKMCCLGFFGLACGLEPERIKDVASPEDIPIGYDASHREEWARFASEAEGLFFEYEGCSTLSETCMNLMDINDNQNLSEAIRERDLIDFFAEIGVEVVFVD
jgi:hypothetical protein